ncbi:MAG: hypothetical protein K2Q14_00455, partial [Gammaproteobacteria bacterium]|nr:hypothetical protein [Gammaproteobacteria bacterium]
KYPRLMKYYKRWFGDFWFREHASTWDKVQAWYVTLLVAAGILSGMIGMLASAIGYIISKF